MRKARKARNPRTGERVDVEPKKVVTFKPGKEMEERVRRFGHIPEPQEKAERVVLGGDDGAEPAAAVAGARAGGRSRKLS
jgi:hypothetical protein